MASSPRAFVLRHTRLRPVPGLEEIELHLADDILDVWGALQVETGDPEAALPYWAVAWGGGLAVGRYLLDHKELVAGRRVFDFGSGSGLCAIAAMRAGARDVEANDIDPFAAAAITLNARANRCRIDVARRDALDEEPPDVDVILAADCWYDAALADRVLPWLRRADAAGTELLIGDPGRAHLPEQELVELATFDVRTTSDLEDLRLTHGHVYRLAAT
jgi:predicted nicotinamide N-methyase